MMRGRVPVEKTFWAFAIVAIIFLAPSSGLITLTIPDEPLGSVLGVPDTPHISKRGGDDTKHIAFVAISTSYQLRPVLLAHTISRSGIATNPYADPLLLGQIRGPPGGT